MATMLERSTYPHAGGLTSGVDYFGNVGQRSDRAMNVNTGPRTIKSADYEVPRNAGVTQTAPEPGFATGGESSMESTPAGDPGAQVSPDQASKIGLLGGVTSLAGQAAGDRGLGALGGLMGAGAAASQGNYVPAASMVAGIAGMNPALNFALTQGANELSRQGRYNGDSLNDARVDSARTAGLVDTAIGLNPVGRAANLGVSAATGLFGDMPTSLGQVYEYSPRGYETFGNVGPIDAAQGQMAIERSNDPLGAYLGVQGLDISQNPGAQQSAARALSFAQNISMDDAMASVSQQGANVGSYGLPEPEPEPVAPAPAAPALGGLGTNPGSQQTAMLAEQDQYFGDTGGGGGDGGWNTPEFDGMTESQVTELGGGVGAADGGLATSNGFMRPMPGITQRYMDGGSVQGPMLSMGYAEGGMMGAPKRGKLSGKPTPEAINRQVSMMLSNPQEVQRMLARPQQLMQTGELTPEEVSTMGRVAEAALFSPELYPQLRAFVAEQGMTPLPPTFDPNVIVRIMAISRALQSQGQGQMQEGTPPGQVPPTDQAQMVGPVPGAKNGGYLQGPGTGRSDSIGTINESTGSPVKVANGEYVIPAHVVKAKGREFFDNLLRRYSDVPKGD